MKRKYLSTIPLVLLVLIMGFGIVGCTNNKTKTEIPILMYHHFDDVGGVGSVVKKDDFKKQIEYLKTNGFNTITPEELISYKEGKGELPDKPVLITSDDGYLSNYDFMYPVLKENNMKATIFVIGDSIDNADKNIQQGNGIPKFNWDQAKEMYDSGIIEINSHTYQSHYKAETTKREVGAFSTPLKGETEEQYKSRIEQDIKKSIEGIENNLGYKPVAFSYPYGEFSDISEEVLKENGIKLSVTVKPGMVTKQNKDAYLLNRVTVSGEDDMNTFINKINGE